MNPKTIPGSRCSWGALKLEVPADFDDETLIILRAPAPPPSVALRVVKGPAVRPTFVIKRTLLGPNPPSLEMIGEVEEQTLFRALEGAAVHSRRIESIGGRSTIVVEASFDSPNGRMRQVNATTMIGRVACSFVATALDDIRFPQARQQLFAIAASAAIAS